MRNLTVYLGWHFDTTDQEEPRVRDVEIARRAGLAQPADVRRIIDKNWDELTAHGKIKVVALSAKTSGGRPGREYWLNEDQAVSLVAMMRTRAARALRIALVKVYSAWRRGLLVPATPPNTAPHALPIDTSQLPRVSDYPAKVQELRSLASDAANASLCSINAIYGYVCEQYKVGSAFDVFLADWPGLRRVLLSIGEGRLLVPPPAPRKRLKRGPIASTKQGKLFPFDPEEMGVRSIKKRRAA